VASLSQGRTAAAQCGLFTHKSVPVIFEPPCIIESFVYTQTKCFGTITEFNFTGAILSRCYIVLLTSFPRIKLPSKTNIEPLHAPVIKPGIENAMEIE